MRPPSAGPRRPRLPARTRLVDRWGAWALQLGRGRTRVERHRPASLMALVRLIPLTGRLGVGRPPPGSATFTSHLHLHQAAAGRLTSPATARPVAWTLAAPAPAGRAPAVPAGAGSRAGRPAGSDPFGARPPALVVRPSRRSEVHLPATAPRFASVGTARTSAAPTGTVRSPAAAIDARRTSADRELATRVAGAHRRVERPDRAPPAMRDRARPAATPPAGGAARPAAWAGGSDGTRRGRDASSGPDSGPANAAGSWPSPVGSAFGGIPTVDVEGLTDQVIRRIDDRLTAHRERFGRI